MPKVSVIVPVYNSEQELRDCLDSLVEQTEKDIEIIVIDDASTDNSPEIEAEYQKKYPNVKVYRNERNLGQSETRNRGIELAEGDYIAFLDSDDYVNPGMYEELDVEVQFLREWAPIVKESGNVNDLLEYLDYCVELKCKLIKVHPFGDGNGRTIRGFINKLLEDVNLPPIYIKATERTEYHKAMNLANNEGDYSDIKNFYRYKICDSIIELDINDTVRKYNKQHRADPSGTYESHGSLTKKVAETVPQDKK